MRVCTWGTGEQERGRVCWLQARAVTDQSRVYFPMFCAESSTIVSSRAHQEGTSWFAVLCGQHTLIAMDCATVEKSTSGTGLAPRLLVKLGVWKIILFKSQITGSPPLLSDLDILCEMEHEGHTGSSWLNKSEEAWSLV